VERVERLVIGTTVATRTVLERRGPTIVYVTNRGFEDVRPSSRGRKERIYDLHWQVPAPGAPAPLLRHRRAVTTPMAARSLPSRRAISMS
jgi:N-methylhydantoinase A